MPIINIAAVFNPFIELATNTLDYIPKASTNEFGIVAIGSGVKVDALGRISLDTQEIDVVLATKASTEYVDASLSAIAGGHKAYQTLALAQAAQASLPVNTVIEVTNDSTALNNGTYQWDGTTLTKSAYDPLTQAKKYADDLSANHVIKVADAISADASQNIYLSSNDIANFYISAQGSQYAGRIGALAGTAIQVMSVKAGETYLFYAPTLTSTLAVSFSKEDSVVALKQLTLAPMSTVSNSIKKVVVPANVNYMFFNTKIPTLNFDLTASLVVNKFKSSFIGYGEAVVADEKAREAIATLETEAVMNSDLNGSECKPNLAVNEVLGFYISSNGSAYYGAIAAFASATMQSFSVEPGKTYATYSTNFINTRFTLAVSDTAGIAAGKKLTPLTLADTSDANVKTFTVPAGMLYAFATTSIPSLSFDIRDVFWVNEGTKTSKFDVPNVTKINGLEVRDLLAQQRLNDLNIVQASVLKGKTWVAVGDSITEFNMRATKNYHDFVSEDVGGMVVINKGVSGSGYHDRFNTIAKSITTANPDFITLAWGTNDWQPRSTSVPLGVFLSTDTTTVSGCIKYVMDDLLLKFPLTKLAIISPIPRLNNYGLNASNNSAGFTLKQLSDLLKQYAQHYSVPFLNLYEQSNLPVWIPAANQHYFTAPTLTTPDGLHPNDAGQRVMADKIKAFLESI